MRKAIQSELLKLKYPPILWLVGFVLLANFVIIFSSHYIDINRTVSLGINPWLKIGRAGVSIYAIFMSIPFLVLLISAAVHIEYQNNGFKQLYTLPKNRALLVLYKLSAILLIVAFLILCLFIGIIIIGYILNFMYPETEFGFYGLPFAKILKSFGLAFVSSLGIIGIQFFLSLRFKGFLVPASIGVLAFIFALILGSVNNTGALYFPYCYPSIARELGVFNNSALGINQDVLLNQVEWSSIIVFFVFILLSVYFERNRNV